jgi:hypothetical protein
MDIHRIDPWSQIQDDFRFLSLESKTLRTLNGLKTNWIFFDQSFSKDPFQEKNNFRSLSGTPCTYYIISTWFTVFGAFDENELSTREGPSTA